MSIEWFVAIILTMTAILVVLLLVFSRMVLQGFAVMLAKIVNKRIDDKRRTR